MQRRFKKIMAADDSTTVEVQIRIWSKDLVGDEADNQIRALTDRVMQQIPLAPYFRTYMCAMRVADGNGFPAKKRKTKRGARA